MAAVAHVTGGRALATVQFASACGSLADRSTLRLLSAGHRGRSSSCSRRRVPASQRVTSKMVIPGFGESPEAKSAASLHNFFTYIAVRIVLSQLQAYNREGYAELKEFTDRVPLKDGDQFCAALMRESPRHKQLAMRILEVRQAYALEDFEWDNLRAVSFQRMEEGNTRLMRDFLMETSRFD
ncbi:hypothetical protein CLOM_g16938 [Closterium sp. NIES-68]|nr:hypothetical protein CLOM_g16938 [Closterium sp. NIES-68]GJP85347.1 hypothetical protein CLOP_g15449 [Closterium sp. NIES-67]